MYGSDTTWYGIPTAQWITDFLTDLDAICERNRQSDEAVAEVTGVTVEELGADVTRLDAHAA